MPTHFEEASDAPEIESLKLKKTAIVYFCRPQILIQTYPPVLGIFSRDFYSKNCPDYDKYIDVHQVHKHRPQLKY